MNLTRRALLDLAAALALAACGPSPSRFGGDDKGGNNGGGDEGGAGGGEGDSGPPKPKGAWPVGIASHSAAKDRGGAVRRAIELAGGLPWLKSGDTVLLKVAHNSTKPYPFTASAVACVEVARMCLDAGAKRVYVADVMGIENTLVPGTWVLENPFGGWFDASRDATLLAFKKSGLFQAMVDGVGSANVGKDRPVHITSFREDGWTAVETAGLTPDGRPRMVSDWVRKQMEQGETWTGNRPPFPFAPRAFDLEKGGRAGMFVPNLLMNVDHIVNLHRVSTHVMSHFTLALKNWVGIMRPDDRVWMHQLSYLKSARGTGGDTIRSEPPYNEILAELHLPTRSRERLCVGDATEIIASGGPDNADRGTYPAQMALAATDPISADIVGLSMIRLAVMAAMLEGGLAGKCSPPPQTPATLFAGELLGRVVPWRSGMYGNDGKLCDPTFSPWDWVAFQRARELKLGPMLPKDLDLRFAEDATFAVPSARRAFIEKDSMIPPARMLT